MRAGNAKRLAALREISPQVWAATLRAALSAHDGYIHRAAKSLGVATSTLNRWLSDPLCADIVRASKGRPKGATNV